MQTASEKMEGHEEAKQWQAQFDRPCDAVAATRLLRGSQRVVVGLSSLGGNVWNGCVKVLDASSGAELESREMNSGVACVCFSEGETVSLVGCDDGSLSVMSIIADHNPLLTQLDSFFPHDDIVSRISTSNKLGDEFCLTSGWDGHVFLWDLSKADKLMPVGNFCDAHVGAVADCAISPFQPTLLSSTGADGFLRLWDSRAARGRCSSQVQLGCPASALCFSLLSEHLVAVGLEDGCVVLVDARSVGSKRPAEDSSSPAVFVSAAEQVHAARVRRVTACSDGSWITASDDATVAHVGNDLSSGSGSDRRSQHADFVADVAVSDMGHAGSPLRVWSASTDRSLRLTLF